MNFTAIYYLTTLDNEIAEFISKTFYSHEFLNQDGSYQEEVNTIVFNDYELMVQKDFTGKSIRIKQNSILQNFLVTIINNLFIFFYIYYQFCKLLITYFKNLK